MKGRLLPMFLKRGKGTVDSNVFETIFFALVATIVIQVGANAGEVAGLPLNVEVDSINTSSCFVWSDAFNLKEVAPEAVEYPTQTAYYAKNAIASNCKQLHHFEIFYQKSNMISAGGRNGLSISTKSCRIKAKTGIANSSASRYVYASRVVNKQKKVFSACLVAGHVTAGIEPKTYIFEELFNSLISRSK